MKLKSIERAADNERKSIKQVETVKTEQSDNEEDNKAWNLTRQLKSRMEALHGKGKNSKMAEKKKRKYKEMQGLSDGDTTPSDFDPNDSDLDSDEDSDQWTSSFYNFDFQLNILL